MNANRKEWNPSVNLDGIANVAVLAAGLLIVLSAALAPDFDAALLVAQVAVLFG